MLISRDFTVEERHLFGVHGKIHDNSAVAHGERVGIILVHGRAGNEGVMWVFSRAIETFDPIVIAPRAILDDEIGGYSWWNIGREVSYPEVILASSYIKKIALNMPDKYGVDPSKIIIIGFSQGGALSISLGLLEPQLFLGVGMLASFVPRAMMNETMFNGTVPLNVFISHGVKDDVITMDRAILGYEFLKKIGANVQFTQDEVAHKISSSSLKLFKQWITELLRDD